MKGTLITAAILLSLGGAAIASAHETAPPPARVPAHPTARLNALCKSLEAQGITVRDRACPRLPA